MQSCLLNLATISYDCRVIMPTALGEMMAVVF
jgi:hypothetical protein